MKIDHRMAVASTLLAAVLLGACSHTPVTAPATAAKENTPAQPVAPAPANAAPAKQAAAPVPAAIPPYRDPSSALYQNRSVYFDFDQYVVKPEHTRTIELHGKFLASHPELAIKIEGNTDEQGGTEYNLALGQKRAEAVRKALSIFGAKPAQMEAISFGKEKPKATGHDEAAHAQNRRADLAYPAQ